MFTAMFVTCRILISEFVGCICVYVPIGEISKNKSQVNNFHTLISVTIAAILVISRGNERWWIIPIKIGQQNCKECYAAFGKLWAENGADWKCTVVNATGIHQIECCQNMYERVALLLESVKRLVWWSPKNSLRHLGWCYIRAGLRGPVFLFKFLVKNSLVIVTHIVCSCINLLVDR